MKQISPHLPKLLKLRRGVTKYGPAPHKPVLLLSLLDMLDEGLVKENCFPVLPELVAAFRDNWLLLVETQNKVDFQLPFFHLSGDKIWRLVGFDGREVSSYISGFRQFQEHVAYGAFEEELFLLLSDAPNREKVRHALLDHYFPATKARFIAGKKEKGYFQDVESSLLEEGPISYQALLAAADEETEFIRSGVFKKVVPRIYDFTCAITGMRVDSLHNISLIDACHIVPFNLSGDDTIRNGIALCPNLHRAFDRGLVSISNDYRVLVSSDFVEDTAHPYALRAFAGRPLRLPFGDRYRPDPDKLAWHRAQVFRG